MEINDQVINNGDELPAKLVSHSRMLSTQSGRRSRFDRLREEKNRKNGYIYDPIPEKNKTVNQSKTATPSN